MNKLLIIKRYKPIRVMVTALLLFYTTMIFAQSEPTAPTMADGMRSNGKIYVVVAVLLTILTGIFIYLIGLDRKISRLEKGPKD